MKQLFSKIARLNGITAVFVAVFLCAGTALAYYGYLTLYPSSDGSYTSWSVYGGGGTNHYTVVDEAACNGTTDYVYTRTVGRRDSYGLNLSLVPDGAVINTIQIYPCASRASTSGSSASLKVFYRWNGVNSADSAAYSLSGTTPGELASTTYSGISLVKSSSSNLQVGVLYSAGDAGARVSRMKTIINYTY